MYNTDIICTYNTSNIFLDTDDITQDDKHFIRNTIYRQELLNIFNLIEFSDEDFLKVIEELYLQIKLSTQLQFYIIQLSNLYMTNDSIFGLMILYSFDYLYLTHICVSEFLLKGHVSQTNIQQLDNILNL
jgi:hypothetical protein